MGVSSGQRDRAAESFAALLLAIACVTALESLAQWLPAMSPVTAQERSATTNSLLSLADREVGVGHSLEDFYSAAIANNPSLQIAAENLNIGSARKREATGQLLPQLSANASLSDNRRETIGPVQDFDGERYSLQLRQVLFNWEAFAARRQAALTEDQLEAEYYHQLGVLLTEVAARYFAVLQAQDALSLSSSELEAVENQLAQVQALRELELVQITDLRQAEASLAAVRAEQIRLAAELAMTELALRSQSGIAVGQLHTLQTGIRLPALDASLDDYLLLARRNNPLIQAREVAVAVAEAQVSQRRGAALPQVSFIAQRQDSNVGFDNAPINQTENTYLGLDVSVPLFAGGANRARVGVARSQRNIARSELRQVELEAEQRLRAAYLQFQAADSLIEAGELAAEAAATNAEAMAEGFALGAVTNLDVLNALRDQYRAQRDLQQARYEQISALLQLEREAGTLGADDLREVGSWLTARED